MPRFAALIALSIAASNAFAADNDQIKQAHLAMNLFMQTCTKVIGGHAATLEQAETLQLSKANPAFSQAVLGGKAGQVWLQKNPVIAGGDFLLVLTGERNCSVWARRADAVTAQENLRRFASKLARPGLQVKQTLDQDQTSPNFGVFHQLGFTMQKEQDDGSAAMIFIATTSESEKAPKQLTISIYPSSRFTQ